MTGMGDRRFLLTGASGLLGGYLLRELNSRDAEVIAWSGSSSGSLFGHPLQRVNLADRDEVASAFRAARPSVVLHAAAVSRVDACYEHPVTAWQVNTRGSEQLVELAEAAGARLLYVSTDLVFDGGKAWYREEDAPAPLSIYGETKAAAEHSVRRYGRGVAARVSLLFGPSLTARVSFFDRQLAALRDGRACRLFADEWRTPLSLKTAAAALAALAVSDCGDIVHIGGPERMSRWEMGRRLAGFLGRDESVFSSGRRSDAGGPEPRPRDVSLDSTRWRSLFPRQPWPGWEDALKELGVAPSR